MRIARLTRRYDAVPQERLVPSTPRLMYSGRVTTMSSPAVTTRIRSESAAEAAEKEYVSVIVPIYNEAAHVEELLQAIEASPVAKEIVIVDDGSTDGTREKLRALAPSAHMTVIFHEENCGK